MPIFALLFACHLLIEVLFAFTGTAVAADGCDLTPPGRVGTVARVLDGETVVLDDGLKLRLMGILTPRPEDADADPALWVPEREARSALESLTAGRAVAVAASARGRDRYGRTVGHLVVVDGALPVWVQGYLVENGHARAAPPADGDPCASRLIVAELEARRTQRGLWRNAAYQVLDAERASEILMRRDTFQIVVGRVMKVAEVRGQVFLNFGSDWRDDFTIAVSAGVWNRLVQQGYDLRSLEGRAVEVRGWVERRNGPMVRLRQPEDLRLLEPVL